MNIKYILIIALSISILIFLFSIYKIINYKNNNISRKYPLRRRNAFTEEQISKILEEINKNKHLKQ